MLVVSLSHTGDVAFVQGHAKHGIPLAFAEGVSLR
jgi:hypothetical protein